MTAIDFKEIPEAQKGAERDTFEMLAAEFLRAMGLRILEGPSRGPDGGRDLLVEEVLAGALTQQQPRRWLVSCKHNAHSGRSVSESDEQNIVDRLAQHACDGFLAFYSTGPSAALEARLRHLGRPLDIWDAGRIGTALLEPRMHGVLRRFFPQCQAANDRARPVHVTDRYEPLPCAVCGTDLLRAPKQGNIVFIRDGSRDPNTHHVAVFAACKTGCDDFMTRELRREDPRRRDRWADLSDWMIPVVFLQAVLGKLNRVRAGETYEDDAFESLKTIFICISQHIFREMQEADWARNETLRELRELGL